MNYRFRFFVALLFMLIGAYIYWLGGYEFVRGVGLMIFSIIEVMIGLFGLTCPFGDKQ